MKQNPFNITLAKWRGMSRAERKAAHEEAGRLGQGTIQKRFAEGCIYVILCLSPDFSQTQCSDIGSLPSIGGIMGFARNRDCVPFEFFADTVSAAVVDARWQELNTNLAA